MLWIRRIHGWAGGILGLLLAALGLTGTLLLYEDAWLRATVAHADEPLVKDAATAGVGIERLLADSSPQLTGIIFPTGSLGLFKLSFRGGAGAYADQSGTIVERWTSRWDRPELWLFDFHHDLLLADTGLVVAGVLALVGLGFVVTGLILWWSARGAFSLRMLPTRFSRSAIIRHHRDIGAATAPVLSVALLTGAMLTLRPVADLLLSPLSPPGTIADSLAAPQIKGGPIDAHFDWRATLQTVRRAYPEAELRVISLPSREGDLVRIRVRQPDEWLPNGRTIFWFDPANGRLLEARDARTLPLATRAFNLVYPLHASTVGGIVYKIAMTAAGLALTLLGTLAVIGFWGYRLKPRAAAAASVRPTTG